MADETKPFAEARDGRLIVGGVTVNYDVGLEPLRPGAIGSIGATFALPMSPDRFPEIAAVISAAADARESTLRGQLQLARGALRLIAECDDHGVPCCKKPECRLNDRSHRFDRQQAEDALAKLDEQKDYVPTAWLKEAEAKLKQMTTAFAAIDVSQYGEHGPVVAEFLIEAGLKPPKKPEEWTEEELLARQMEADRERARRRAAKTPKVVHQAGAEGRWFCGAKAIKGQGGMPGDVVTCKDCQARMRLSTRPHDPARIRRLMGWGASAREAEQHIEGATRPIWALAERLVELGIDFDYRRLDSSRDYYEAAQQVAGRGVRGARINAPDMLWR